MANTYHQVKIQAVFAVKYRESVLLPHFENSVYEVIAFLINETGCKTILVNGTEDHIHCLFGLKPTISISDLMKIVKSKSSKYINDNLLTPYRFEWQSGYGAFSYSQGHVDRVFRYIQNQKYHHQSNPFYDEYIDMLNSNSIPYDERWLFDELI